MSDLLSALLNRPQSFEGARPGEGILPAKGKRPVFDAQGNIIGFLPDEKTTTLGSRGSQGKLIGV